jgi:RES domain-containing protein
MSGMRRRRPAPPRRFGPAGDPDLPSLHELERFSEASLHQWLAAATRLETLHSTLYFELESLRQRDGQRLIEAIGSRTRNHYDFQGWSRIVDYRYALEPLSTAGSVKNEGGRFNIGAALSPGAFSAFPALYIAQDYDTAFLERFGASPAARSSPLSPEDLALRRPESFTQVRLQGVLENVLDVGDLDALRPVVSILKDFPLPKAVGMTARKLGLRQSPWLIRSPVTLRRQLLHANWRMLPMQFDLPSNSQIFGRLVSAAGIQGILYPSTRDSTHQCLALFPQNWVGSGSFVEVMDPIPDGARVTRVDGATHQRA